VLDFEGYKTYFLSYDLVIGFFITQSQLQSLQTNVAPEDIPITGIPVSPMHSSAIRIGNSTANILTHSSLTSDSPAINLPNPSDTYAFAYYIKPNYPGRSSHLCNGGFMVPSEARGMGLGRVAARSFCFYAPACGYKGSVFNLVYADNEASVRLWEKLGFVNVGKIPKAGRLKKKNGEGDEFVDAWVVYGDFEKIGFRDGNGGVAYV
jgi:GNAT superfamily N-acetyltransferase